MPVPRSAGTPRRECPGGRRWAAVLEAIGDRAWLVARYDRGVLVHADNLSLMRTLPDGCCDLIYADPPFMSGRRRTSKRSPTGFDDSWSGHMSDYLAFLMPRLEQMRRLLADRGSLYLHLDWRTVHYVRVSLDALFGADNFLNEIIWSYRTGGRSTRWFARKHDTLLLYARNRGSHTFNLQHEGRFRTDGLKRDENGRPYKSTRAGRLYFNAAGPAMTDVWPVPFLSTVALERTGFPSQKPAALLERVVWASSNTDDVVADFFCGSGTTLAVAYAADRRWIGCDCAAEAIRVAARRLTEPPPRPPGDLDRPNAPASTDVRQA